MTRVLTIFLTVITAIAAVSVYQVKYDVMNLEDEVLAINAQIVEERDNLSIYQSEWSYLNEPRRLERLAFRNLDLTPVNASQFMPVAELPLRPEPGDTPLTVFLDDGTQFQIPRQKPALFSN